MNAKQKEKAEAIENLQDIKPGNTVYTILRHTSASGMSRAISVVLIRDNKPQDISYWVARALDYRIDENHEGVKVGGCGMDMGFHLIYSLGRALFPEGFTLAEGQRGRNGDSSGFDEDGGYALKHRWL